MSRVGGMAEIIVEGRSGTGLTGDYLRIGLKGLTPERTGLSRCRFRGVLQGDGEHLYIEIPQESAAVPG